MSELPKEIKKKLDEWFGGNDKYSVLHFWENFFKDTYYVVCRRFDISEEITFIRIFKLANEWVLSQDGNTILLMADGKNISFGYC